MRRMSRAWGLLLVALGTVAASTVRTAGGFETGAPAKPLSGRYTTTGSTVAITWDGGVTETWAVSTPAPGLSAISLTGSSYGANVGQGYGSNVTAATFVPLSK